MIVVDTSVAIKWVVEESGHEQALQVIELGREIAAPDFLIAEMTNVLRKKVRAREISPDQALKALVGIPTAIQRLIPSSELSGDAFLLAQELDHSAYDCFFLAAALGRGLLVSADAAFIGKCRNGGFAPNVMLLEEIGNAEQLAILDTTPLPKATVLEIKRLAEKIQEHFEAIRDSATGTQAGSFTFISVTGYGPALDSPAYRRLRQLLRGLDTEQRGIVLALGWLGRSYHSVEQWPSLVANSRQMMAEGLANHEAYVISQMQNVAAGFGKIEAWGGQAS